LTRLPLWITENGIALVRKWSSATDARNPAGRSKWRYEDNGPPLAVADRLVGLLKDWDVVRKLDKVKACVTESSWSVWEEAIRAGLSAPWLNELNHLSTKVRYPADGMA
jgi:hypothetical protein